MAKFVYLYTGGQMADTPEAQEQAMQAWGAWFATLGESVTDTGNPLAASVSVSSSGSAGASTLGVGGYSVITADTLEEAAAKVAGCPVVQGGGSVEVYEAIPM
jgi:hypothetical protein